MKRPKSFGTKLSDRYWSVNMYPPTWHEGFLAALDMIGYEITANGLIAETILDAIKDATRRIEEVEAEGGAE